MVSGSEGFISALGIVLVKESNMPSGLLALLSSSKWLVGLIGCVSVFGATNPNPGLGLELALGCT